MGTPLTRWVIINFEKPPAGDEFLPQRQFCAIRKKAWSWWANHRSKGNVEGPFSDCRIWECPDDFLHVNWLLRVPDTLLPEFQKKLEKWVAKVLPDNVPNALYEGEIFNVNGLLKYTLKGTDATKADRFGIDHVDQGEVWGRRAVASMNLGKAARERDWETGKVVETAWRYRRPSPHAAGRDAR